MTRSRALVVAPVLALLAGLLSVLGMAPAQAYDRDCGDFGTQRAAQLFYLGNGGPRLDPHRLDEDDDGIACESNSCPCLSSRTGAGSTPSTPPRSGGTTRVEQSATVVHVTDGDTVAVRLSTGGTRDVRLVGIDTPEVYGRAECGGTEASRSLRRILPAGTRVTLYSDPTQELKDRYGRLLRYVHKMSTGRDVNRQQVYLGHARVYVYDHHPFRRVTGYRSAAAIAKAAERGLWGRC